MRFRLLIFFLFFCEFATAEWRGVEAYTRNIIITGNTRTKEQTIKRELWFTEGDTLPPFYKSRIRLSKEALTNLNLFNSIHIWVETVSEKGAERDTIDVHVELVEKWYIWPLPFIEFADRNFNQWYLFDLSPDRTNYGLYFFTYNNLGRNQTLKLSLVGGYTDLLGLEYRVPYLRKFPRLGFELKTNYKRNHEIWLTSVEDKLQFLKYNNEDMIRRYDGSLKLLFRPKKSQHFLAYKVAYGNVDVADTVVKSSISPHYLLDNKSDQQWWSHSLSVELEDRNNKLYPTDGTYLFLEATEQLMDQQHYNFMVDLELSLMTHSFFDGIWGFSSRLHYSSRDNLPYIHLPALGYSDLIRGFENYVITGQFYGLTRSHYKYPLHNKMYNLGLMPLKNYKKTPVEVYGSAHFDIGRVKNRLEDPQNQLQNSVLIGYGAGFDMLFYREKLIRIEYSFTNRNSDGLFVHFKKAF